MTKESKWAKNVALKETANKKYLKEQIQHMVRNQRIINDAMAKILENLERHKRNPFNYERAYSTDPELVDIMDGFADFISKLLKDISTGDFDDIKSSRVHLTNVINEGVKMAKYKRSRINYIR